MDGGDVLKVDRTVYVGVGSRTNPPAVAQLAMVLAPGVGMFARSPCTASYISSRR